jgi:hypothetical protein
LGAVEVRREVTVAKVEPGLVAVPLKHLLAVKGVAPEPPTLRWINQTCQSVGDDVQVRRYMEFIKLGIVSNISNYRNSLLRNDSDKTFKESSCANSPR